MSANNATAPTKTATPAAVRLPFGVAFSGMTGTGKTTSYMSCPPAAVQVLLLDPGSLWVKRYHPTALELDPHKPIFTQIHEAQASADKAGKVLILDSFTRAVEVEIARRTPRGDKKRMLSVFGDIVGEGRDLALALARANAITLFNLANGGTQVIEGAKREIPAGILATLPSLAGIGSSGDSILSLWSESIIITGSLSGKDGAEPSPRGYILPAADWRTETRKTLAPSKDPLNVLRRFAIEGDDAPAWAKHIAPAPAPGTAPDLASAVIEAAYEWNRQIVVP